MTRRLLAVALATAILLAGVAGPVAADIDGRQYSYDTAGNDAATDETHGDAGDAASSAGPDDDPLAAWLDRYDLTDGQRDEIRQEVRSLREAGASRLVIRSAVVTMLWEYGVDAPILHAGPDASRLADRLGERFDLTDEQVATLERTIEAELDSGASRAALRRGVARQLLAFGVEKSAIREAWRERRLRRARALHDRAHDAHARAHLLHDRAHRLHRRAERLHHRAHRPHDDAGAGDDRPTDTADRSQTPGDAWRVDPARVADRLDARFDLTDEQAAEVEALVERKLESGAPRAEIRTSVRRLLASYGVVDARGSQ